MSFNQLGKLNFPDLHSYSWQETDFDLFQTYIQNALSEIINSGRSYGIIYGGQITLVSGLTIKVSKSLVLFSNGLLATVDDANLTLGTADPTNPRLDRIEAVYSLVNGSTVLNTLSQSKTLDKLFTNTPTVHAGTPAGSPTAPVTTAGALSYGAISVAANQTILTATNVDQSFKSADFSRSTQAAQIASAILNNQASVVSLQNLALDKTQVKSGRIDIDLRRKDDSSERRSVGSLFCVYRPVSDSWDIWPDLHGDEMGVVWTITAAGQIQYTSDNMAGGNYVSDFEYKVSFFI